MNLEVPDHRLAGVISEAAFNPARWVDVCDGMARQCGGCGSVIFPSEGDQKTLGLPYSTSLEGSVARYMEGEWYQRDLRHRGVPVMRRRGYMTDADCIAYDDVEQSGYFQDFLKPVKLRWFVAVGFGTGHGGWKVSIQRKLGLDPFSESEIGRVVAYRDLLNNSAAIARQLGFAQVQGATSVLEQQGLCAIALNADERVVHVSPSAECHLQNGLRMSGGKLDARRASDAAALARLIRGICAKDLPASQLHVSLSRAGGKPPLVLYGCALPDAQCDMFQPAVALLVISDPGRPQDIPSGLIMDYFGLTPSEAGLAVALLRGTSVDQFAVDHGKSPATVRNHLQALLHKTSTHRQGELIAVLNKVVPRK